MSFGFAAVSLPSPAEGEGRDQGPWQPMLRQPSGQRPTSMKSFLPPSNTGSLRQPRFTSRVHNYDPSSLTMPGGLGGHHRGPPVAAVGATGSLQRHAPCSTFHHRNATSTLPAGSSAAGHPHHQQQHTNLSNGSPVRAALQVSAAGTCPASSSSSSPSSSLDPAHQPLIAVSSGITMPPQTSSTATPSAQLHAGGAASSAATNNSSITTTTANNNSLHKQLPSNDSRDSCYSSSTQSSSDTDNCHGSANGSHDNLTGNPLSSTTVPTTRLALAPKVPRWRATKAGANATSGARTNYTNGTNVVSEKIRGPLEEESADNMSDGATTTSGSFVVDLDEPEIRTHSSKVTDILV